MISLMRLLENLVTIALLLLTIFVPGEARLRPALTPTDGDILLSTSGAINHLLRADGRSKCSVILVVDGLEHQPVEKLLSQIETPAGIGIVETVPRMNNSDQVSQLRQTFAGLHKLRKSYLCTTFVVISRKIEFLHIFGNVSTDVGLLVWSTRTIVVTDLSFVDLKTLLAEYPSFSRMNTVAISLRTNDGKISCDIYSHLPYTSKGPDTARIARWTLKQGLSVFKGRHLFPQKYQNFHKAEKKVVAYAIPPYYMKKEEIGKDGKKRISYIGREALLLRTISQKLNFSYTIKEVKPVGKMVSETQKGAFASVTKVAMLPRFSGRVDFTSYIDKATLTFIMTNPVLKPQWQNIIYPLKNSVWLCIVLALLIVPIILTVVTNYATRTGDDGKSKMNQATALRSFGMFLGQDFMARFPDSNSVRFLLVTWIISSLVISTVYRSNLTAHLTIPKYPKRIDTLDQLAESPARVTFVSGSTFYNYFKRSGLKTHKMLSRKSSYVANKTMGFKEVLKSNTAFMDERLNMDLELDRHYYGSVQRLMIYIAKENVLPFYTSWQVPKGAPYKENIDRIIFAIRESGLLQKWSAVSLEIAKKEMIKKRSKLKDADDKNNETDDNNDSTKLAEGSGKERRLLALTLVHFQGAFFLIVIGIACASAVFVAELAIHEYNLDKKQMTLKNNE